MSCTRRCQMSCSRRCHVPSASRRKTERTFSHNDSLSFLILSLPMIIIDREVSRDLRYIRVAFLRNIMHILFSNPLPPASQPDCPPPPPPPPPLPPLPHIPPSFSLKSRMSACQRNCQRHFFFLCCEDGLVVVCRGTIQVAGANHLKDIVFDAVVVAVIVVVIVVVLFFYAKCQKATLRGTGEISLPST